ncbi:MAG: alpha/beta hydrolase [Myxococcota bacterium]
MFQPSLVWRSLKAVVQAVGALPPGLQAKLGGARPVVDGHQKHPEVAFILRLLNALPEDDAPKDLAAARKALVAEGWLFGRNPPEVAATDLSLELGHATLRARHYQPRQDRHGRALVVYFHGGGWVLGDLDSTDGVCRELAELGDVDVLSIDYRLAPEHPYPAAVDDAVGAYVWAVRNAARWGQRADQVLVAGDSAGGNLAAVTCLRLRDAHRAGELKDVPLPRKQVLFCPVTDLSKESASYESFATGHFLTRARMRWYIEHYVPRVEQRREPLASPLLADDLSGLPPALVAVAGFDVLRDEGVAYAERLRAAGVEVELFVEQGHVHAFVNATGVGRTGLAAMTYLARRLGE